MSLSPTHGAFLQTVQHLVKTWTTQGIVHIFPPLLTRHYPAVFNTFKWLEIVDISRPESFCSSQTQRSPSRSISTIIKRMGCPNALNTPARGIRSLTEEAGSEEGMQEQSDISDRFIILKNVKMSIYFSFLPMECHTNLYPVATALKTTSPCWTE